MTFLTVAERDCPVRPAMIFSALCSFSVNRTVTFFTDAFALRVMMILKIFCVRREDQPDEFRLSGLSWGLPSSSLDEDFVSSFKSWLE